MHLTSKYLIEFTTIYRVQQKIELDGEMEEIL